MNTKKMLYGILTLSILLIAAACTSDTAEQELYSIDRMEITEQEDAIDRMEITEQEEAIDRMEITEQGEK